MKLVCTLALSYALIHTCVHSYKNIHLALQGKPQFYCILLEKDIYTNRKGISILIEKDIYTNRKRYLY